VALPLRILSYPHMAVEGNALADPRRAFTYPISTENHVRVLISIPVHSRGDLELGERYEAYA
jgi:hypothetical protein